MKQISAPASLTGAPLAELKRWLSISVADEDEFLASLIAGALALCERFTGIVPFKCEVRETIPCHTTPHVLAATPVISLIETKAVAGLDERILTPAEFDFSTDGAGGASLALLASIAEPQVELRYYAGLASEWEDLDEGLRQGVIRHAAHLFREREQGDAGQLPASIAALWRPWRRLRL